jgi:hypothetical protein
MKQIMCVAIVLLLAACGKKVTKGYEDMVGVWVANANNLTYTINIGTDNSGTYSECSGLINCTEFSGPAKVKDNTLKFGFKKLAIDAFPVLSGGIWYMKVDGNTYFKQ